MASSDQEQIYKALPSSCHGFTSAFHKELSSTESGNIVSSPLSIHMILSLLSHGAAHSTLEELRAGLHHGDIDSLNEEYQSLMSIINDMENIKLYVANAIYVGDGMQLAAEFLSIGTNVFRSSVSTLDFKNNIAAAQKINAWVKEATENQISDIVSSDDFDEFTKLVLVNAIYFKGRWLHEFNVKHTKKRAFHVSPSQEKLVPTMFKKATYNHGELPELHSKFIEIPYLNKDIAMIIILPDEVDGLQFAQSNLNWDMLIKAPRSYEEVELRLPKFKFEATLNLKNVLRKIGMKIMFEDNADFSGLTEVPLKVSKVLHKAVIEVCEEGTEAAAATVVQMRLRRMIIEPPVQFTVNRPFMFIIEHRPSKLPLFVGSVRDVQAPLEKDEL